MSFLNKHSYVIGALLFALPVFSISANQLTNNNKNEQNENVVQAESTPVKEQSTASVEAVGSVQKDAVVSTSTPEQTIVAEHAPAAVSVGLVAQVEKDATESAPAQKSSSEAASVEKVSAEQVVAPTTPVKTAVQVKKDASESSQAKDPSSTAALADAAVQAEEEATESTPAQKQSPVTMAVDTAEQAQKDNAVSISGLVVTTPQEQAPLAEKNQVKPSVKDDDKEKSSSPTADKMLETSSLSAVKFHLNSEEQRRAYASGVALARYLQENMAQQQKLHITLDPKIVLAGIVDTFGNDIKMDEATIKQTMDVFDDQVNTLNKAKVEQDARQESEMGKAFQAEFAQQDGVKKNKTGLLYLIEKKGSGAAITDKNTVELELQGMLINGTVFDKTTTPIIVKVADVIPALRSGIKLAGNGGKIKLVVPSEQAYGEKGALPSIPPNATLVFEITVLRVNPSKAK
ncbi:FKBP-type peptidyl-prolyl cis-trans isomerase [Pragia fontium]|uniref:FKBP-type peptidyl-prolyl cis-trans isomerase n=1 Tax=Pragia fontium TaxID=82985 RepID=UPI00069974A8|nr:FKBP-type peptidyl-prolyl cis-trans isomerase [Pragia fontium]